MRPGPFLVAVLSCSVVVPALPRVHAQQEEATEEAPEEVTEGAPATQPAASQPTAAPGIRVTPLKLAPPRPMVAEDPYLTNYKLYEHRDERPAGRGPQGRKLGLGAFLGRPTGVGGKLYFTQTIALQLDLGATYSWNGPEGDVQGHLVWHFTNLLVRDSFKLSSYVGAGGRFALWPLVVTGIPQMIPACREPCRRPVYNYVPAAESFPGTLGVQGLGGLSLHLHRFPLELYAQPVVTVELFPGLSADLGAQAGVRWYVF